MKELKSFPYDSVNNDREYSASYFRDYFRKFMGNGIYQGSYKNYGKDSMKVEKVSGHIFKVCRGAGIINGIDFELEEDYGFNINEDGIYTIIVRVNDGFTERNSTIEIIEGTNLEDNKTITEMALAEISINSDDIGIKDKREQMHGELLAPYYPENELPEVLWRYIIFPDSTTEEEKYYIENNPQLKNIVENSRIGKVNTNLNIRIDNEGFAKWERENTGITILPFRAPPINGYVYDFSEYTKTNVETGVVTSITSSPEFSGTSRTSQTYDPEKEIIYYMAAKTSGSSRIGVLYKYDIATNLHTELKTYERITTDWDYLKVQYDAYRKQLYVEYQPYSGSGRSIKIYDENLREIFSGTIGGGLDRYYANGCIIEVRRPVLKNINNSSNFTEIALYHRNSSDSNFESLQNLMSNSDKYTYFLKGFYVNTSNQGSFVTQGLLIYDQELSKYKIINLQNTVGSIGSFFVKDNYLYMNSISCRYKIRINLERDWIDIPL